jgi:hypothetical protein
MLSTLAAASGVAPASTTCLTGTDPEVGNDAREIGRVRALIYAACPCGNFDGSPGKTHEDYVRCARDVIDAQVDKGDLRRQCRATVRRYHVKSTCGRDPQDGLVPCVQRIVTNGRVTCAIRRQTACDSSPNASRVACANVSHCIDAADGNYDLLIEAPGDDGTCAKTIDEPYRTDLIVLVGTASNAGYTAELYRNMAYTCGYSGYHTFVVAYPTGVPRTETRPLWMYLHGGGFGAFDEGGNYIDPTFFPASLDEETFGELAGHVAQTGLMAKVRAQPAGFRFLIPSMCDHDVYSGVGVPEVNNPYSPDENGNPRAADGHLAAKAAIEFTHERFATSHAFLHGTSAGSGGAFPVAYTLEHEGRYLSGVIMDSGVNSDAQEILQPLSCGGTDHPDAALLKAKIGPFVDPRWLPDRVMLRGELTAPVMHVWTPGDPTCCGFTPITFTDDNGVEQTMAACDFAHEDFRAALAAVPPGGASENYRICVNDPLEPTPLACNNHTPTTDAYDARLIVGDQFQGGADYNAHIFDWVLARMQSPPPSWR